MSTGSNWNPEMSSGAPDSMTKPSPAESVRAAASCWWAPPTPKSSPSINSQAKNSGRGAVTSEVLSPPQTNGDVVVAQTVDGKLTALDAGDGARRWIYETSLPALTLRGTNRPVITPQGYVIAGFSNGTLVSVAAADGIWRWEERIAIPEGRYDIERVIDADGDLKLDGNRVLASSYQGNVMAFDTATGRIVWGMEASSYHGLDQGFGNIYYSSEASHVVAVRDNSNEIAWTNEELEYRALTGPKTLGNYIAVADFEGWLHVISQIDGRIVGPRASGQRRRSGQYSRRRRSPLRLRQQRNADGTGDRVGIFCARSKSPPVILADMKPVIAIVGRPNVGKSTLFNRLTASRDALTVNLPGLTRDRQYGKGEIDGREFLVIDMGGITPNPGGLEREVFAQALQAIAEADCVLFLVDARDGLTPEDSRIHQFLRERGKPGFLAVNKTDGLDPDQARAEFHELGAPEILRHRGLPGHRREAAHAPRARTIRTGTAHRTGRS